MKLMKITSGEFKDWMTWPEEPYEHQLVGPFYFRDTGDEIVCAFRAEERHMNQGNVMHGGCLMSFADFSLFAIAHNEIGTDGYGVTVAFNAEFLDGPHVGELIEAHGEVLRAGKSLIFVRGIINANGRPCLNYSGTIKRLNL